MTWEDVAMTRRRKWTIAALILVPVLLPIAWFIIIPRSYEFRLRQASRIDVRPVLGEVRVLTSDRRAVEDITCRISLWPARPCACAFAEDYIFRSWAGDVTVRMSGHAFVVGCFVYETPTGFYDRVRTLRVADEDAASRRATPIPR